MGERYHVRLTTRNINIVLDLGGDFQTFYSVLVHDSRKVKGQMVTRKGDD